MIYKLDRFESALKTIISNIALKVNSQSLKNYQEIIATRRISPDCHPVDSLCMEAFQKEQSRIKGTYKAHGNYCFTKFIQLESYLGLVNGP